MELHNVIQKYIGCEVIYSNNNIMRLLEIFKTYNGNGVIKKIEYQLLDEKNPNKYGWYCESPNIVKIKNVKPILRHLKDLSELEIKQLILSHPNPWCNNMENIVIESNELNIESAKGKFGDIISWHFKDIKEAPKHFYFTKNDITTLQEKYLLNNFFDLYGLIDSGQAIDMEVVKKYKDVID